MSRYLVSIVDMKEREIYDGVKEAIDLVGGIELYVKPGNLVFIKPNMFIFDKDYTSGKTTDPRVTIAVARMVKEAGGRVIVGERTKNPLKTFEYYPEIYDYAEVISLDDAPHHHGHLFGAKSLSANIPIVDIINECDVFINIPGFRTHMLPLYSNAMKNLMGLLPSDCPRHIHKFGLEGSIVDLNYHRPSDLVISDAIYSLQGNFPGKGWPAETNVLMASNNAVAADVVGAEIMGFAPTEINFLVEANQRGMGPISLDEITIKGKPLSFAQERIQLEQTEISYEPYKDRVTIIDHNACSACKRGLIGGLADLKLTNPEVFAGLKAEDLTVIVGPLEKKPEIKTSKVLCYGNCTYKYRELGKYQFGCPPLAGQARTAITDLYLQSEEIKIGYCSLGMRDKKIEDVIEIIAKIGYQGVELWFPHLEDYEKRHGGLTGLKELLKEKGLEVSMIVPYFKLTKSEEEREESYRQAEKAIGYAKLFGTKKIRAFVGGPASADATQKNWDQAVKGLRKICDLDKSRLFLLETHDHQLQDTISTTLKLIRKVARKNLLVNLDIYNLYRLGEDPVYALEWLYPVVNNIHVKNWTLTSPEGRVVNYLKDGPMDYAPFFTRLKAKGYSGYVSVEWFGEEAEIAARHEFKYLQEQLKK